MQHIQNITKRVKILLINTLKWQQFTLAEKKEKKFGHQKIYKAHIKEQVITVQQNGIVTNKEYEKGWVAVLIIRCQIN